VATVRTMTPDIRRKIFRQIDDHWDEDAKRYRRNNSDEIIARDLNVPRDWVRQIREEAFGEIGTNDEIEEFKAELDAAIKLGEVRMNDALKLIQNNYEAPLNELKAMRTRLQRIEATVLPRR
jgi:hypothetical protein